MANNKKRKQKKSSYTLPAFTYGDGGGLTSDVFSAGATLAASALDTFGDQGSLDRTTNKDIEKGAAVGALQGAGKGAQLGSVLGPIGAGVGAGVGFFGGALMANKKGKQLQDEQFNALKDKFYGANGGSLDPYMLAMGGDIEEINGPRHEEGGVQMGANAEVEGGEVKVDDYIFSDRLGLPDSKSTFADEAKKIKKKYELRDDAITLRSQKAELTKLMEANEQVRLAKEAEEQEKQASQQEVEAVAGMGQEQVPQEPMVQGQEQVPMEQPPVDPMAQQDGTAQEFANGGPIDPGKQGMMKARMAYEEMHGNPAAKRMVSPTDNPYQFDNGDTGTHFMGSYGNYAIPNIQDDNGLLKMTGPRSNEAMRFDSNEDANYFAKNYKTVAPALKYDGGPLDELNSDLASLLETPQAGLSTGNGQAIGVIPDFGVSLTDAQQNNAVFGEAEARGGLPSLPTLNRNTQLPKEFQGNSLKMKGTTKDKIKEAANDAVNKASGKDGKDGNSTKNEEKAFLASSLPALDNMIRGMKPEVTQFDRVKAAEINFDPQRAAMERQANIARNIQRENVRGSAKSSGEALTAMSTGNAAITGNLNEQIGQSYMTEENANAQIRNQANQTNTQISNQEIIANEQNRAMAATLKNMGLSDISTNYQGYLKDKKMSSENIRQNDRLMSMINATFPDYDWASDNGEFAIKWIGALENQKNSNAYGGYILPKI